MLNKNCPGNESLTIALTDLRYSGSVFIRFMPGLCTDHEGSLRRVSRFLTFNECGYSVVHETPHR